MKLFIYLIVIPTLAILSVSCTKEVKYSKEAIYKKAQDADPSVTFIMPKMNEGVRCEDYTPTCMSGHIVSVRGLEMLALEYPGEAEARKAAIKYRGYYTANWFFDDVTGEPLLEKFVQEHLDAKKPGKDSLKKD